MFAGRCQRVAARYDHRSVPAIHRQTHQMRKLLLRTRGYREIDAIARDHFGNLLRGALMQMQAYLRIFEPKGANYRRQHVARLGMRGGD